MSFTARWQAPGVCHMEDCMGVCMTLFVGEERALLLDTGYGIEDVAAFVQSLTDKPLQVVLTHGHHDHALGARWFERVSLLPEEIPVYETYTAEKWRKHVLRGAANKGIKPDEATFLGARMAVPEPLEAGDIDLGGLTLRLISCPGHTPGSLMAYVPEHRLLLTGDNWNPCTWLFFAEAVPIRRYRAEMRAALDKLPFEWVICPHSPEKHRRELLDAFLAGLTDEAIQKAEPFDAGYPAFDTVRIDLPYDQYIVFDRQKALA
ncbi:MAG: MBL fold metallo-hydrolase [Clostridia bacterium]|nr:MBL fold metallo-hydrolase [Clostridia bacterium]